ncbi:DNA polymerase III beta subunit [Fructilactobacillus florum 8D]|uniref:Beta sliding clamp n=1 Tax=Fructilactobacillus florum 8D TaxID=1221538 RepID=W9EEI5_9LACO|nr:DNA polymerase III subunit beta [Fructilactobacillus florum]ETO40538.1 DNA polymerase III beta subunit [Fructilactobacillus florum 8D]
MNFSINRVAFIKALNVVQRAISAKTTIPILTGLKIDVTDHEIMLTGSNADISIQTTISTSNPDNELQIQATGSLVLSPARFFAEIVKKLPDRELQVDVADQYQTTIKSGNSEFNINGLDANGYPHLPEIDHEHQIELPAKLLREVISQTVIAVSKQESRPILTGVHFTLEKHLLAVATDSHRLSQREVELESPLTSPADFVIPGDSLKELSRMLDDEEDLIKLSLSENQVLFTFGETQFYSRLLEGNYPDTSRLIPNSSDTKVQFAAGELLAAVERASLLSHESRNNVIKLTIKPADKQVMITGNSPDVGKVEENLEPQALSGNDLEISFNPDYLREALRVFGSVPVEVAFTSALRPFTIKPLERPDEFIQLITPVRTF